MNYMQGKRLQLKRVAICNPFLKGVNGVKELKFRAWDKVNRRWLDGNFWQKHLKVHYSEYSPSIMEIWHDKYEDYVIDQYIGLRDIAGRDIFERDIVRAWGGAYAFGVYEYDEIVEIKDIMQAYELSHAENLEIVGNVYEGFYKEYSYLKRI